MNQRCESSPVRIMLVDDHMVIRMGLATAIGDTSDLKVVAEVECGEEALETYERSRPDVVVLDLRMRGMGGVETIRVMRKQFRDAKIIVFSNYAKGEDAYRAISAGAAGFVVKDMPISVLLEAIRSVSKGGRYLPDAIAARVVERTIAQLSPREIEVIEELAKGGSNKEIANRLGLVEGTVKRHIANILLKLGALDRTHALVLAIRNGIISLE
ncbi:response regulator transcription factor [Pelagicoccus sp. SDUM812003]|uniref:response regulator transcription factor n=1 Tax=Pelagicoccus sp. SDUM812003 TaxID=3041267 RepID=UPI00280EACD8|nr:response regulator transcription factor [Pelagicoccus sp. SDUM812003]MDQ8203496.1 response regulator transcription factor [Pelagicoccus sp. SDUM812003]